MEDCHTYGWWSDESDWNWIHQCQGDFPDSNDSSSSFMVPLPVSSSSKASRSTSSQFHGNCLPVQPWNDRSGGFAEDNKRPAASKSHSLAEKRRRDRINAQLESLRKLVPKSEKMDKAALLGSVIDQVKDLKRKASEISKNILVPTETDEVTVDFDVHDEQYSSSFRPSNNNIFIRASVCCDDRPELFAELIRVLKGLRLTTVKADITSVGGRTRSILVLCSKDSEEGFSVSTLRNSLKVVLSRIASASMASSCRSIRSKRQRFFLP